MSNFFYFSQAFAQIFQSFSAGREGARSLMCLCQGGSSVLDYAIELRTLAADSGWNNSAHIYAYISGLSQCIKEQLISLDLPDNFDNVLAIANNIDCRL